MQKSFPTRIISRYHRSPIFTRVADFLGKELSPARWVFIVGCYNSGTTLLDSILQRHPEITGLDDEGVMLTNQLNRPEDYGWTRMWAECSDKIALDDQAEQELKAQKIKKQWSFFYPRSGKQLLLEKSIANTPRMRFFERYFQPISFIHLVRNGYAVAEGIRRKAQPGKYDNPLFLNHYPIDYCARQWRISWEMVEQQRPFVKNFLEVRYEDLCATPLLTLNRIAEFLSVKEFQPDWIDGTFSIHNMQSTIKNQNPKSISRLTANDIAVIEKEMGPLLLKLNYQPENVA